MNTHQRASSFYLERVGFEMKVNMRQNLKNGKNLVGRAYVADDVDIGVDSPHCSGRHCEIMVGEDYIAVTDLNATNGTTVNGRNIKGQMVQVFKRDAIGIVGGHRAYSELVGNYNCIVYRLCEYNRINLETIEIDDDIIFEIENDADDRDVTDFPVNPIEIDDSDDDVIHIPVKYDLIVIDDDSDN